MGWMLITCILLENPILVFAFHIHLFIRIPLADNFLKMLDNGKISMKLSMHWIYAQLIFMKSNILTNGEWESIGDGFSGSVPKSDYSRDLFSNLCNQIAAFESRPILFDAQIQSWLKSQILKSALYDCILCASGRKNCQTDIDLYRKFSKPSSSWS